MSTSNLERQPDGDAPRSALLEGAALAVGALLALWGLQAAFGEQQVAFDQLALGEGTESFARVDGDLIHCRDLDNAEECLSGLARRGSRPVVLWFGNSQLHVLNQYEAGQETSTATLHRRFAAEGLDFLTFSQPNANLQEHLVLYTWLTERLPVRALVLPIVFDDCRETGMRKSMTRAFRDPAVVARLEATPTGAAIVASHHAQPDEDLAALSGTIQARSEAALVGWLDRHWALWAQRPQVRGTLFTDLFRLRNAVFGITSVSTRRMIPGRLTMNLDAARALLEDARARGIATVVYVAPLRGDVPPPYVAAEYAGFRRDVARLAAETGARFADLDALVPPESWGTTQASGFAAESEIDFMHFRTEGHVLLADAVGRLLRDALGDAS